MLFRSAVTDPCGNREIYEFFGLRPGSFNGGWSIGLLNKKEVRDSFNFIFEADNNIWIPYQISNDGSDPVSQITGIFLPLLDFLIFGGSRSRRHGRFAGGLTFSLPIRVWLVICRRGMQL